MVRIFGLFIAVALAGCSHVATVSETKPPTHAGFSAAKSEPLVALDRYLAAAERASQQLEAQPADIGARGDYNFAVARMLAALSEAKLEPWKAPVRVGPRTVEWKRDPRPERNPALYEITPTDQLKIGGSFVDEREIKDGLGAPLVAKRVADQAHEFAPTPHFFFGLTAIARFEGSRCFLAFEDPLASETTRLGRSTFPLAADFTAPLAMMLVEMQPEKLGIPRLLHPAKFADSTRIARLEPYDPNKTVVLVIHGLMDSPATWFPLINHLRSFPDVRRNYQFWFFSYPTGYPYSYSAALLRKELDHAEQRYPLRKKMVVIGHSMGGCVSRLLITDTQRRVWDDMFNVSPDQMDVAPEHKHVLTESTIFRHRPEIGRVIFISSPLRGSDMAKKWMGRIGAALVQIPENLASVARDEARYEKHAAWDLHLKRFPDSVDTLAPNNHFVVAINKVPIASGIPYHTICGDRGRGDAPNSTDGVVPYWSSHLPGAESEKVVASHHPAHRHPDGIAEVHRILKLHANLR